LFVRRGGFKTALNRRLYSKKEGFTILGYGGYMVVFGVSTI